jgi:hypothetical protein
MGSELVGFEPGPLREGVRGDREGVEAGEVPRGGAEGARVSWSIVRSLESMVTAALRWSDPPQEEQNRPVEGTCAPQEEQYMGKRDSIIAGRLAASYRGGW